MMPELRVMDGPTRSGLSSRMEDGILVKVAFEPLLRQLHAITLNAGKPDFESVALWADGLDLNRLARRLRRRDDGLRREIEWNAEDISVFHVEESFIRSLFVHIVGLTA